MLDILDFGTSINHLNRPLQYRPARTRVVAAALLHAIDKRRPLLSKVMPEGVPLRESGNVLYIFNTAKKVT